MVGSYNGGPHHGYTNTFAATIALNGSIPMLGRRVQDEVPLGFSTTFVLNLVSAGTQANTVTIAASYQPSYKFSIGYTAGCVPG